MKIFTLGTMLVMSLISLTGYSQTQCTPHNMPTNDFDSKAHMQKGGQWVAHDFFLTANTENFSLEQVTANLWSQGGIESMDIIIYHDVNNHPGEILGDTIFDIIPTSQEILINKDDGLGNMWDVHDVIMDLPVPVDIAGTPGTQIKYWLQLIATPTVAGTSVGWDLNFEEMIGSTVNFANPANPNWNTQGQLDGVFALHGQCTYIEGCQIPATLTASNLSETSVTINWVASADAVDFVIEYGPTGFTLGEGTEMTVDAGTTSVNLEDLDPLTFYDIYIKSICEDGESAYTVPFNIRTDDIYCETGVANVIEPITYVEFEGIENSVDPTIDGTPGHMYFLDQVAVVERGGAYTLTVEGNGGGYENGYTVFFDWNQDGIFNLSSERYDIGTIDGSTGDDGIQASTTIEVPQNALPGMTRMRVMKEDFGTSEYPASSCAYIGWGQIHDYSVNVEFGVGVNEFEKHEFTYGPNPTRDFVNLNADGNIERVTFYNIVGQKVLDAPVQGTSSNVSIAALSAGTYFMEVTIGGERDTFKIIKN